LNKQKLDYILNKDINFTPKTHSKDEQALKYYERAIQKQTDSMSNSMKGREEAKIVKA
jgi:hypothetical protein